MANRLETDMKTETERREKHYQIFKAWRKQSMKFIQQAAPSCCSAALE